jgi:hypothetical protein
MGMHQTPASGYTISLDNLRKLCPGGVDQLMSALEAEGLALGEFARQTSMQEDVPRPVVEAFDNLCYAFHQVTGVEDSTGAFALDLELGYYDTDLGDGGDDVEHTDGAIFLVDGVVVRTPAGEKFKDMVNLNLWSVFG